MYAIGQLIRSFYGEDRCLVRIDEATGFCGSGQPQERERGGESADRQLVASEPLLQPLRKGATIKSVKVCK